MDKTPYIGKLDRKIIISKEVNVANTTGEAKPTLETVANPWAFMEDLKGDEEIEGAIRHLIDRKYTIRYNKTIAEQGFQYKLTDGALQFRVYHIKEIGRRNYLQLLVTTFE